MLDFLFEDKWGPFLALLFFQLPFMIGFFYIVFSKAVPDSASGDAAEAGISRWKIGWLSLVVILFVAVNLASIKFIPAVYTSRAEAAVTDIVDVDVTASSWSYEFSSQEFTAGQSVRFTARATDTVHGFAVYHPNGKVLFTMMLIPGIAPSALVYTFQEPGLYKVRCLEYCGIAHHDMNDEITVLPAADQRSEGGKSS